MLTANQTTYEISTTRKAHIKRGQTLRSRANNKAKEILARQAHKKGQTVNSRAKNIRNKTAATATAAYRKITGRAKEQLDKNVKKIHLFLMIN